jgi:hypothetical protein
MFDVIYFHAVMLVRYVMSLIKATYLLTYLFRNTQQTSWVLKVFIRDSTSKRMEKFTATQLKKLEQMNSQDSY